MSAHWRSCPAKRRRWGLGWHFKFAEIVVARDTEAHLFNIPYLHRIREEELKEVIRELPRGARVLDFGAGSGHQAAILRSEGFEVTAIDLANSDYSNHTAFEIIHYDGKRIPLPDDSVDVIFSSNVLEHVENLSMVLSEFARVLRSDGIELHLMPTPGWRFWTFIAGVPTAAIATASFLVHLFKKLPPGTRSSALLKDLKTAAGSILPIGHGTSSEGISELWTFSVRAWKRRFRNNGHKVIEDRGLGIFYTGHMLFGERLSFANRRRLSRTLGSAVHMYRVRPKSGVVG